MRRFALHHRRARPGVVFGRGHAGAEQRLDPPVDGGVVLAVDGDQAAVPPRRGEHAQELRVVQAQRVVGEEHLEAPHPVGD